MIPNSFFKKYNEIMTDFLSPSGVAVPCTFVYGCRTAACTECGGGSADPMVGGPSGAGCGFCDQKGHRQTEITECVDMAVIFTSKNFKQIPADGENLHNETATTISDIELMPKIRRAQYVILDSCNECYKYSRFVRSGEPETAGLKNKSWVVTRWIRKG